jgi:hypothetical protein
MQRRTVQAGGLDPSLRALPRERMAQQLAWHSALMDGWLTSAQCRALVDPVDGHCWCDPDLVGRLPQPAWEDLWRARLHATGVGP